MSTFVDIFGGNNIYPSDPTYLSLAISANTVLQWPVEQAMAGSLIVADIIDVSASVPGLNIALPDATEASTGFTALFNNIGAQTVSINNSQGATLLSLAAGTVWQLYLVDNTTAGGTWRVFQFGASVSVAVAAALAGSGLKAIGSTLNERMVVSPHSSNYVILNTDRASVQQWTSGVGTFTLPDPTVVGGDWFVVIKNSGSGNLTVNPTSGLIDGNANLVLAPGGSAWLVTDGINFYGLGEGGTSSSSGAFNLITINVAGSGSFTLSGVQLNQIGYKFTGALTGNRSIIVPNTAQEYWVDNETSGAFTLTVGTAGQITPITVLQSNRNILYCDGSNVLNALTSTVSFPISVPQGGTGATTAASARTNLGSTAVGDAVFTAASVAAAQAALAVPPTSRQILPGTGLLGGGDLSADRTLSLDTANTTGTYTVKPADTTRSSNNTPSADPDLQVALVSGQTYEIELCLNVFSIAANVNGLKWGLSFSGGSWTPNDYTWLLRGGGVQGIINSTTNTSISLDDSLVTKLVFTALANGTLSFQWAQNTAAASGVTVKAGSFIRVRRVL